MNRRSIIADEQYQRALHQSSCELTFRADPLRHRSAIEVVSRRFSTDSAQPVSMPFAVTPFGPLTLATAWALYPELIDW
jgi:hypothetical protein